MRPVVPLAATAALVVLAACTDKASPTGNSSLTGNSGKPPSTSASAYVDTALGFEQEVFYYASKVNFPAQQTAVRDSLTRTHSQGPGNDTAYFGPVDYTIDPFLRNAGDEHSAFFHPADAPGASDAPANDPRFNLNGYMLGANAGVQASSPVAYFWYPAYSGKNDQGHVDSTEAVIRSLDQNNPCGYILDLRLNYGGSIFPMLAGLSPLTGDAPATSAQRGLGGWVDYTGATLQVYSQGGGVGYVDRTNRDSASIIRATTPYTLQRAGSPVAILTGPITASAGEFITLSYRGSPVPSRVFGEPTYGVTTVPYYHEYRDGGFLNITAAVMTDRTGNTYGQALVPDQSVVGPSYKTLQPVQAVNNPDVVVKAAVAWLNSQPSCGGTAAVAARPAYSRDAIGGVVPTAPGKLRGHPAPVSRHWVTRSARAALLGGARQR